MTGRSPASQGRATHEPGLASRPGHSVGVPNAETRFVAPWTPPERMWGGLARAMMMWLDMHPKTPRALFRHLESTGQEIPQWLRDEPELQALDHVPSKGTRCVLIYRAMLWDGRSLHLTPSGHTADCEFHCEQYPHECTCGATLGAAQRIEARSDETVQLAQPEGREPGPEGMRPRSIHEQ